MDLFFSISACGIIVLSVFILASAMKDDPK
jgi:hypothetical protein